MKIRVFDIEANGLLEEATIIHCLVYYDKWAKAFESVTDPKEIKQLFEEEDVVWCGHNITSYDIPLLVKLLGIKRPKFMIDTLAFSWILYPHLKRHGLSEWGEYFGIPKPVVKDWENLPTSVYIHRCEEDVKINAKLWSKEKKFLDEIYQDDENLEKYLRYIHEKMDDVRIQEEVGLSLDVEQATRVMNDLANLEVTRKAELEAAMPKVPVYAKKLKPKVMFKKDGSLSEAGIKWNKLLAEQDITEEVEEIKALSGYKEPNAGSSDQIKDWLYSFGWVPDNIKFERNKKTGEVKQIPQIASKKGQLEGTGAISDSVKALYIKEPKLELIEGLSQIINRKNILKGFLRDQRNGRIYPSSGGLTNTLRLQHRVIVNLPAVEKNWGEDIRGCIIASPGCTLMGADLANIEDRTKRHYIYKYDPAYVEAMNTPGYDAHLEIALLAGFLKQEEVDYYKKYEDDDKARRKAKELGQEVVDPTPEEKAEFIRIKAIRTKAKTGNFSLTYKVGLDALARNTQLPRAKAQILRDTYWKRNKAILDVEDECKIREVDDTRWLQNPISGFWYSLRSDKDKFSTLNQGTAVYVFDCWLHELKRQGTVIPFQYHDECLLDEPNETVGERERIINESMITLNDHFKLNIQIGCSVHTGQRYSETH